MADVHLWDNTTAGYEPVTLSFGSDQQAGNAWSASVDGYVNGLRYRRHNTGTNPWPDFVTLWRESDGAKLAEVRLGADQGSGATWIDLPLTESIPIVAGETYIVAMHVPATHTRTEATIAAAGTPPSPLSFESGPTRYVNSGGNVYPASTFTGYAVGVDVAFDTSASHPVSGGLPTITGDLPADLEKWLSADGTAQTHETDGLPWLTKAALDDGTNGLAAIKGAVNTANTRIGSLAGLDFASLAAGIAELWARTATLLADSAELIARVPATVGDSIASLLGMLTGNEGSAIGALSARSGFPTELWTMADTVDFVQAKSWDVPADLYTLSTSGWPINIRQTLVDGAPWRPRLGWWAVRNGDLIGQRRFIDWENSILEDGGRRMPGVVVWLEPDTAGTLEAWLLT